MKPGFYISMGIAIGALVVGFILLNDVQQENELKAIWIQKVPSQCNDVWAEEYNEFYEINPEMSESSKGESKNISENIIKSHYEKQGINILDLKLEIDSLLNDIGYLPERRKYTPHATIARVRHVKDSGKIVDNLEEIANETIGTMTISGFNMMKSTLMPTGPVYDILWNIQ